MAKKAIANPSHLAITHQCINCGVLETSEKFKVCSGCKSARFCGNKCRKNGWKKHEVLCKSIQILDEQNRNTPKIPGDSNDDHIFNSHLTPLEHQKIAKLIGQKCEINCSLDGIESKVLLNTGADVSLISRHFLHKFFAKFTDTTDKRLIRRTNFGTLHCK